MKKQIFKALVIGAVVLVAASLASSCNKKSINDLDTRVTVLEGMVKQLEADIKAAVVTGATIISADQDEHGIWAIVLSNGQTLIINTAGGSSIAVEETPEAFIFIINEKEYVIPKTSSAYINSMVYVPEYEDAFVFLNNDGGDAKFLATPAITAEDLAGATIEVADARQIKTRAGGDLLKVETAAIDGDLIAVHFKGIGVQRSTKYTVAVRITVKGTTISSNYFTVQVSDDFGFDPIQLIDPQMKDDVQKTQVGELTYRVLIPNSAINFIQGFKLTDWFKELPEGNVRFELAPVEEQNENTKNHYGTIQKALSADGTWKLTERLGTDCWDGSEGNLKNGILIYTVVDDVRKHQIFWQIDNPIPGMGGKFDKFLGEGYPDAQHMEMGLEQSVNAKWIIPAGAGVYDIANWLLTAQFPEGELLDDHIYLRHGNANTAIHMIQEAEMTDDAGETLIGNDGSHFYLGDYLKLFVGHARGLVWRTTQPSWVSSIRENWPDEAKAACNGPANGEILGGWDGGGDIPGLMGWEFNEKGLQCFDSYQGWGFRSGLGMYFEYELGDQTVGPWHWAYVFFNRRVAPYDETKPGFGNDPDAR